MNTEYCWYTNYKLTYCFIAIPSSCVSGIIKSKFLMQCYSSAYGTPNKRTQLYFYKTNNKTRIGSRDEEIN